LVQVGKDVSVVVGAPLDNLKKLNLIMNLMESRETAMDIDEDKDCMENNSYDDHVNDLLDI